jgi:hypothetical protein
MCKGQIRLSNGIGQMELSCVGLKSNSNSYFGVKRNLAPKEDARKVSLRGLACPKCIPRGWLVMVANAIIHDPIRIL